MNLTTLVERAGLESGYNDTDDIAAGKKFARHWDEHIHNYALWKDALVVVEVAVDPTTNEDHAEGTVYLPDIVDRVVAVRSTERAILIQGQEHYYRMDYDTFTQSGEPIEFMILPPAWFKWRVPSDNSSSWIGISGAVGDAEEAIRIIWLDGAGKRTVVTSTVGGAITMEPDDRVSVTVLAAYKPATDADVVVFLEGAGELTRLAAAATASPSYARIQLIPKPTAPVTLRVLAKAKYLDLDFDQQEPALRNLNLALLAFIRGSLKRRGGEGAAAATEFGEGNALLKQASQIEALQAANNQRFTPEEGYGPEYGIGPGGGNIFH